jgi:hypothetical protein
MNPPIPPLSATSGIAVRRFAGRARVSSWIKSHSVRFAHLPSRKPMRNLMTVVSTAGR